LDSDNIEIRQQLDGILFRAITWHFIIWLQLIMANFYVSWITNP